MTMNEDREILAAEYVLGTLDADRARAGVSACSRPIRAFATLVRAWEETARRIASPWSSRSSRRRDVWQRASVARPRRHARPKAAREIDRSYRAAEALAQRDLCRGRARGVASAVRRACGNPTASLPRVAADGGALRRGAAARQGVARLPADGRPQDQSRSRCARSARESADAAARTSCGSCIDNSRRPRSLGVFGDRDFDISATLAGYDPAHHQRGDLCGLDRAAGRLAHRRRRPGRCVSRQADRGVNASPKNLRALTARRSWGGSLENLQSADGVGLTGRHRDRLTGADHRALASRRFEPPARRGP